MVAGHIALAFTNIALRERLHHQAIHDALTGLYNRRYLDQTLPHELAQASQTESPVGLIMLDIDHFKYFNDTYGHDAGDAMLRIVGNALRQHTRSSDITCRYGGEEFTVVLPGASIEISQQRAEQLRRAISTLSIEHNGQVLGPITISLGVSAFPQHSSNADDLVKAADIALYQAKVQGRNRVMVSDQQPEMLPMVAQTSPYPHL
ncbi:MAG: GGDEF domain-containing protein [Chloroflexaceae bacterium]|nr:GGDEF domain-containing protein [Chloroflexaceae bacterium]